MNNWFANEIQFYIITSIIFILFLSYEGIIDKIGEPNLLRLSMKDKFLIYKSKLLSKALMLKLPYNSIDKVISGIIYYMDVL